MYSLRSLSGKGDSLRSLSGKGDSLRSLSGKGDSLRSAVRQRGLASRGCRAKGTRFARRWRSGGSLRAAVGQRGLASLAVGQGTRFARCRAGDSRRSLPGSGLAARFSRAKGSLPGRAPLSNRRRQRRLTPSCDRGRPPETAVATTGDLFETIPRNTDVLRRHGVCSTRRHGAASNQTVRRSCRLAVRDGACRSDRRHGSLWAGNPGRRLLQTDSKIIGETSATNRRRVHAVSAEGVRVLLPRREGIPWGDADPLEARSAPRLLVPGRFSGGLHDRAGSNQNDDRPAQFAPGSHPKGRTRKARAKDKPQWTLCPAASIAPLARQRAKRVPFARQRAKRVRCPTASEASPLPDSER